MTSATGRLSTLASRLPDDVDGLLVTDLANVRYLTGFTGSNAAVMVCRDGRVVFATDGRYVTQAAREVPDIQTLETRQVAVGLAGWAAEETVGRWAIEADHVSVSMAEQLRQHAGSSPPVPTVGCVEAMRIIKDDNEIEVLTTACAITDAAFTAVLGILRPGVTERDVAWSLMSIMRANGAEALAFDSIVAFGPHSAIPHHQATDRPLALGDFVTLDFGARYAGYHADMTRTVVLGAPREWQTELHETVAAVQQVCRDATIPGAASWELDNLARERIGAAGHELVHGLGHGVGLEVHEEPYLTPNSTSGALTPRMCVTIEPGVYLPGRGGVRIEDTALVTVDGHRPLTASARELIAL